MTRIAFIFNSLILVILIMGSCSNNGTTKASYFVNLNKLYEGFEYTKVLEADLKQNLAPLQEELDSIYLQIQALERMSQDQKVNSNQTQHYYALRELHATKKSELTESEQLMVSEYDNKLWTQLNQYVKEYCRENHIGFLHGANGSGGVMYADSSYDRTEVIIEYVNKRFHDQ